MYASTVRVSYHKFGLTLNIMNSFQTLLLLYFLVNMYLSVDAKFKIDQ